MTPINFLLLLFGLFALAAGNLILGIILIIFGIWLRIEWK